MNKLKWKNKQSIHEGDKRTAHPRLTLIAKDSEGGDKKSKWKNLKKSEWKNNQSICSRRPG